MKPTSLLIFALVAFAGYFIWKSHQPAPARENNPQGGEQQVAPTDTFGQVLGTLTALFGAVKSVSQTTPSTT